MSVADLMHDDHLVIHSDFPLAGTRGRLQGRVVGHFAIWTSGDQESTN